VSKSRARTLTTILALGVLAAASLTGCFGSDPNAESSTQSYCQQYPTSCNGSTPGARSAPVRQAPAQRLRPAGVRAGVRAGAR
jgi:hypothetical protein